MNWGFCYHSFMWENVIHLKSKMILNAAIQVINRENNPLIVGHNYHQQIGNTKINNPTSSKVMEKLTQYIAAGFLY
ncbi:hypothetical protein XIS1_1370015 [Xenorhabdus innexi]|uniref:Uncharacterized protein n=1 Tax=Xenorhabdus innexi TaxID=290109 RepID=A0A1N6MTU3_9GAMM|nr:hypothetical protein XIS1_1370015 [Xenorhabdus innexi]